MACFQILSFRLYVENRVKYAGMRFHLLMLMGNALSVDAWLDICINR